MKNIQKIDNEMIELFNLIQNEHFNESSKKIIIQKFKKMIFDFRVLKEILDENEFFAEIHDKNNNKINNKKIINNDSELSLSTSSNELLDIWFNKTSNTSNKSKNIFENMMNKSEKNNIKDNDIHIKHDNHENSNHNDFFIENELIDYENDIYKDYNNNEDDGTENINLIPKTISNSSICDYMIKKNE